MEADIKLIEPEEWRGEVGKSYKGVTKASITKLTARMSELKTKVDDPTALGHAQKLKKLESLDSEFKQQHLMVTDSITEDA